MWLAGILVLVVAFFWALGRFSRTDPKKVARLVRRIGGAGLVALGGFLILRGAALLGAPLVATGLGLLGYAQFADRLRGTVRRPQPPPPQGRGRGGMSRAEALAILGLGENATARDIKAAHRRLMKKHHPDKGGDGARAARINAAKEVLLG